MCRNSLPGQLLMTWKLVVLFLLVITTKKACGRHTNFKNGWKTLNNKYPEPMAVNGRIWWNSRKMISGTDFSLEGILHTISPRNLSKLSYLWYLNRLNVRYLMNRKNARFRDVTFTIGSNFCITDIAAYFHRDVHVRTSSVSTGCDLAPDFGFSGVRPVCRGLVMSFNN